MTTQIIINAHCSDDKEVIIEVLNNNISPPESTEHVLQNGELKDITIYEGISILNVMEQEKKGYKPPVKETVTSEEIAKEISNVMGNVPD